MSALKNIVLEYCRFDDRISYRVVSVSNSLEYNPGRILTHDEVQELCNKADWIVHIVREK